MSVSSISRDYLHTGLQIADALARPRIVGLHLPTPVADETFRDEFGFVFLADGSVGPFYVSMGDILQTLWQRHPDPANCNLEPATLLQGFAGTDLADRALALGSYNALSASLYRSVGFVPPDRDKDAATGGTENGPVGLVGYFCPLVERLTARGREVLVLEQAPERVAAGDGLAVTTRPADLRRCSQVLCTASTLINDSLEEILLALEGQGSLELIGPSGSGVPDPVFARGVRSVGGIRFPRRQHLTEQLAQGQPWGSAGIKYKLGPGDYPGLGQLLSDLVTSQGGG